jgi:hypothetical protein
MQFRWWRHLFHLVALLSATAFAPSVPEDIVLVRDGKSEAQILVAPDAPAAVLVGIDTLRHYVREISGADLPVVHDSSGDDPRIVVEIGASSDPGLRVDDLGVDGFRIKTVDRDLVFTAKTGDGFRNAVYTFLETYLGCRKYSVTVQIVPRAATISLPTIDDTQVPPLAFRMQDFRDVSYVAWHKLDTNEDFGLFVHTFDDLVSPEKYFQEHPEYFSLLNGHRTPNGQLCLTNPEVFPIVVDELRARMRKKPDASFWSVSQNDTYCPCECESCRAIDDAEGSHSGSILAFVNRIAAEFPDKTISTLAYQYSRAAPRNIRPLPNVNIMLCSIECNRSWPIADDPGSASFVRDVRDWGQLTNNIFLWDYVIQFRNLVSPFPNLRVLQPNLQFFVESGITSVFEQGLPVMHGELAELRIYILSKLLWDPDTDVEAVMDDFLKGYYGPAAPHIRQYIDTMHDALETSGEDLSIYGYPLTSADGYLSPDLMDTYDDLFDAAEASAADDPQWLRRVQTARLPVQFARLEQAKAAGAGTGGCFVRSDAGVLRTKPEIDELLTLFVQRCHEADIPRLWEHGSSPQEYLTATRRFLDGSTQPHLALGRTVALERPASAKYHDGEAAALTDGYRGWNDYHFHWLGFEGEDMNATVDLGAVTTISAVATDFLQDINSWVFMPLAVSFAVSKDGRCFEDLGRIETTTPPNKWGAVIEGFSVAFAPTRARYVRVAAASRKTCPTWHKGSGGPSWIFVDEIAVR